MNHVTNNKDSIVHLHVDMALNLILHIEENAVSITLQDLDE